VSNVGPVASSGLVTVSDALPAGLNPTTASGAGWSCAIAGQAVSCTRSDALPAGASYPVIAITVAVSQSATSPLTNTATVAGGNELNTSNDSASDPTAIASQADIVVTKTASSGTVTTGSNVTFTITAGTSRHRANLHAISFTHLELSPNDRVWISLENASIHLAEHAVFFTAGLFFWLPVLAPPPVRPVSYPARLLYLLLALPQGALLAAAIASAHEPLYSHYAQGLTPASALIDQSNAAAIMWIAGGLFLLAVFLVTAGAWAYRERGA